ncbi:4'-phosphopantetheinyl transferase superfamily protein [Halomonas binhaiensis]|uniref:4'-phosphopantetheinyl transferase superfamily protein n=1 Tax=Halomonas binhaiensis TaxID=2562282 RepID=A0A856QKW3_9GAMM|nr:4'-phosphopantetheinyl transferase superfamily protein [Halomonas binhaiensis]QEM80522.2 4'-phosphopantetheinyl transferase superfamily protein [Halomonas binhaiensis]
MSHWNEPGPARLLLALARTGPVARGAGASRLGRELLSQLAAEWQIDCPLAGWSPRGHGPVHHDNLPNGIWPGLSHRRDHVIAALSNQPIGLDIECSLGRHVRRLDRLVEAFPTLQTRTAIRQDTQPLQAFYRAWTLHEALFKLAWCEGKRPAHVLSSDIATMLDELAPNGTIHVWQYQDEQLTIHLCIRSPELETRDELEISTPLPGTSVALRPVQGLSAHFR